MKYIKTYENLNDLKVGDYVKFNRNYVVMYVVIGKIIEINKKIRTYNCEYILSNEIMSDWVYEKCIERKASPEEIERYKMLKYSKKYNL